MRQLFTASLFVMLTWASDASLAVGLKLSLSIPGCKMPLGKQLPMNYTSLVKDDEAYRWLHRIESAGMSPSGSGYARWSANNEEYDSLIFTMVDMNSDGWCDWFVTSRLYAGNGPGGPEDIVNTFYLGRSSDWKRIGIADLDREFGPTSITTPRNEFVKFELSSASPLVVRDVKTGKSYLIGHFDGGAVAGELTARFGYRIYTWDSHKNAFLELDKWIPGSEGAFVYAFFKQHGAVGTIGDYPLQVEDTGIVKFDTVIEQIEFDLGCKVRKVLARSPHFARACKSPRLPAIYEELLLASPVLKKQDKYLNNAYQYLTAGYDCPAGGVSGCFICGLPRNKIPTFKIEQKRWLTARDKAAKQAGAFGSEPYVAALIKLTTKRNGELKKRIETLQPTDPRCKNYLPIE